MNPRVKEATILVALVAVVLIAYVLFMSWEDEFVVSSLALTSADYLELKEVHQPADTAYVRAEITGLTTASGVSDFVAVLSVDKQGIVIEDLTQVLYEGQIKGDATVIREGFVIPPTIARGTHNLNLIVYDKNADEYISSSVPLEIHKDFMAGEMAIASIADGAGNFAEDEDRTFVPGDPVYVVVDVQGYEMNDLGIGVYNWLVADVEVSSNGRIISHLTIPTAEEVVSTEDDVVRFVHDINTNLLGQGVYDVEMVITDMLTGDTRSSMGWFMIQ
ncbi:MAG: hypothetical protein ABH879_09140 [archaeon]